MKNITLQQKVKHHLSEFALLSFLLLPAYFVLSMNEKNKEAEQTESQQQEVVSESGFELKPSQAEYSAPVAPVLKPIEAQTQQETIPQNKKITYMIRYHNNEPVKLDNDFNCLAVNAYFESRNQTDEGMTWIMWTVRNRVGRYHNKDICDAVLNAQKDEATGRFIKNTAHYSWVADGVQDLTIGTTKKDLEKWEKAKQLAALVLTSMPEEDPTKGATHYHKIGTKAWWISKMEKKLGVVDKHIFYRGW
jgi:spore germination cell wall hydrolase CwlJ-like protein